MKAHSTQERLFIAYPQNLLRLISAVAVAAAPWSVGAQAPSITNITLVPQGTSQVLRLTIHSRLGVTNQIQYTNVLKGSNWSVLTNLVVAGSPYVVEDPGAAAAAARFYRVALTEPQVTPPAPAGMALIPAGSFTMGDTFADGQAIELPTHTVPVSAFYMDTNEVTQALWDTVKNWNGGNGYTYDNPGSYYDGAFHSKGSNHPVHAVNWFDVVKWCNARSQKEGLTPLYYTDAALTVVYKTGQVAPYVRWNANGYRLPTEAEWEKAARGGASGHRFPWSDADTITHSRANYYSSTSYSYDTSATRDYHPTYNNGTTPYTSPVGSFAPNGYGLYDMAGNVGEWCWDWGDGSWYNNPLATAPDTRGPASSSIRVYRGGGWSSPAISCRTAFREGYEPSFRTVNIGFRSVRAAGQ